MTVDNVVPLVLGVVAGLVGLGLIVDAWSEEHAFVPSERRRRVRAERHKAGEALVGLGVLAMAGAFIGRDSWRYSIVVVMAGAVLMVVGAVLNRSFIAQAVSNRGPLRRGPGHAPGHGPDLPPPAPTGSAEPGAGRSGPRARIR